MFYQLKVRADAKKVPASILGFPVNKEVSTYVETTRDLVAEAGQKKIKAVDVLVLDTLPERGEDGNAPHVIRLGDHGQNTTAVESETTDEA